MNNARRITGGIPGLNDEILGVIFSRLPVKTLMRLKCLYKDYSMLISSPWFINLYSKRFSSIPDNHCIFVQTGEINRLIHIQNPGNLIKLNEPCTTDYTVIGSINGLICLVTTIASGRMICIWNPAIEQYKMFPVHNDDPEKTRKCYIGMGFGYDKDSDDYKVMRILSYKKGGPLTILEIYSTNSECWKEVKSNRHLRMISDFCDVIIEGLTCWIAQDLDGNFVLASFVWSIEEFFIIAFPEEVITAFQNFVVTNYHGSFALLTYSSFTKFKGCVDVWEIELDIAAKECEWIKKNTFDTDFSLSMPWVLTGGDIVVENAPNMPFLFNLTTKQRWEMRIKPIRSLTNYTQSLVSIKGFRRVRNQLKRKRKASNPVRARLN
ncbi:F-box/kelch-repeat protein At3g23880-like [Solanum lycopersicum]|uniref:F-box/kelch-repeat protein At3g23880-like n=1 Tax=Solanum lycopersicum TaxID=4081 RepID=UPI000532BD28|nr:F-box/kelch-repeat protein At3g23880-like [Solanum lycopersicum]